MACMEPFAQITGTARIYIAPKGEAPPAITAGAPGGNWVYLGETDGEQSIEHAGELTFFRTNERTGPAKAIRPEEDVIVSATLVETTLENYGYVINRASAVVTSGGPDQKRLPNKRGACPQEYALLMWGSADSPYGLFPAFNYLPRVVSAAEPEVVRSKDGRRALEAMFQALEDTSQAEGDELGWAVAQTGA
jgi:hypothetical protein